MACGIGGFSTGEKADHASDAHIRVSNVGAHCGHCHAVFYQTFTARSHFVYTHYMPEYYCHFCSYKTDSEAMATVHAVAHSREHSSYASNI